ncbi:MAG: GNAT family N-acetyltransferase [Pseudomonadota bacterium]
MPPPAIGLIREPCSARLIRLSVTHAAAFAGHGEAWSATDIGAMADRGILIATTDDDAFILISLAADEAEILTIAVAPALQGAGLGQGLLSAAITATAASGARRMFLEVAADNAPARAIYNKAGFRQSGRRKAYYKRGAVRVDALVLSRALT